MGASPCPLLAVDGIGWCSQPRCMRCPRRCEFCGFEPEPGGAGGCQNFDCPNGADRAPGEIERLSCCLHVGHFGPCLDEDGERFTHPGTKDTPPGGRLCPCPTMIDRRYACADCPEAWKHGVPGKRSPAARCGRFRPPST